MIGDVAPPVAVGRFLGAVGLAPPARTLIDVSRATARGLPTPWPSMTATARSATPASSPQSADVPAGLRALGVGRGDRVGVRLPSGTRALYVAILGVARRRRGLRPGRRRRPGRAGRASSSARPASRLVLDDEAELARAASAAPSRRRRPRRRTTTRGSSSPRARPARRRASRSAHRSAAAFVDAEARLFLQDAADRAGRPGARRPVGRLRRLVRGDVAGLAARRLPRAGAALARAQRRRPRRRGWSRSGSPSSRPCRRWPRCGRRSRSTPSAC